MEKPLVSVIVPAYNVEAYLGECLDSILAQTYDNFELIVIDDASTDNTSNICETYQNKDQRVQAVHLPKNSGPSAARNKGMDLAKGKYISFVDGDDLIAKNLLTETVYCAEKHELDEVSFGYRLFSKEQEWKYIKQNSISQTDVENSIFDGKKILSIRDKMRKNSNEQMELLYVWSWLYNRSFLNKNNLRFLHGILHEDVLFWFQCCIHAKRVMRLDKELYFYRKNTGSITTGWHNVRAKSIFAILSIIYAEWSKNTFTPEEHEAIKTLLLSNISQYRRAVFRGETEDISINPTLDFGYKLLQGKLPYIFGTLPANIIDTLCNIENIFVYGAGAAAADVFDQLEKLHIKPTGVMVSHKKGNTDTFGNVPEKTLLEWGLVENAAVIVAVTKRYRSGIEDELRRYGYTQIINVEES